MKFTLVVSVHWNAKNEFWGNIFNIPSHLGLHSLITGTDHQKMIQVQSIILAQQIPFVWISRNASYYFASEKLDSKDHVEVAFVYTTYLMPI